MILNLECSTSSLWCCSASGHINATPRPQLAPPCTLIEFCVTGWELKMDPRLGLVVGKQRCFCHYNCFMLFSAGLRHQFWGQKPLVVHSWYEDKNHVCFLILPSIFLTNLVDASGTNKIWLQDTLQSPPGRIPAIRKLKVLLWAKWSPSFPTF